MSKLVLPYPLGSLVMLVRERLDSLINLVLPHTLRELTMRNLGKTHRLAPLNSPLVR